MNKFMLIGNLTDGVKLKQTEELDVVGTFNLAVNNVFKKDKTHFFRITVWNKTAKNCKQFLKKGSKCYVEGTVEPDSYIDENGEKKYITNFNATYVEFLTNPKEKEDYIEPLTEENKEGENAQFN